MGHNPATREVKKGEKKVADALRTPEERLAAIRGSLAAKLFVTPDDVRFLFNRYVVACSEIVDRDFRIGQGLMEIETLKAQVLDLKRQVVDAPTEVSGDPVCVLEACLGHDWEKIRAEDDV
jgi:hypothetical protein